MQSRLERQEQRQVQMMQFLSKALQHPEMLQSLVGARQQRFDGSVQGAHCACLAERGVLPTLHA